MSAYRSFDRPRSSRPWLTIRLAGLPRTLHRSFASARCAIIAVALVAYFLPWRASTRVFTKQACLDLQGHVIQCVGPRWTSSGLAESAILLLAALSVLASSVWSIRSRRLPSMLATVAASLVLATAWWPYGVPDFHLLDSQLLPMHVFGAAALVLGGLALLEALALAPLFGWAAARLPPLEIPLAPADTAGSQL